MERFTITPVDDESSEQFNEVPKYRNEIAIDVNNLRNARRNSKTVPNLGGIESRRISLAQLTR